eukprot:1284309-Prymnesium_polylepis.1
MRPLIRQVLVFKSSAYYKVIAWGVPTLAFIFGIMVTGMLTIMAFRLVVPPLGLQPLFGLQPPRLVGARVQPIQPVVFKSPFETPRARPDAQRRLRQRLLRPGQRHARRLGGQPGVDAGSPNNPGLA